jgi:hypothetical protein
MWASSTGRIQKVCNGSKQHKICFDDEKSQRILGKKLEETRQLEKLISRCEDDTKTDFGKIRFMV